MAPMSRVAAALGASRPAVVALAVALACFVLARPEPALAGWQSFNTGNGLAGNAVYSMLEDRSGNLWFGTEGAGVAGVSRYDGASWHTFTTADGLASDLAFAIVEDHAGNLWASSWQKPYDVSGRGVSRFDGTNWRTLTTADGLADDRVTTIFVDHAGNVWIGTFDGVSRFDGTAWRTFRTADGLASGKITAILEDHAGRMWFATASYFVPGSGDVEAGGLSRYDGASWRTFTTADAPGINAYSTLLLEDRAGNVWCAGWGASRYDGSTWRTFWHADGLGADKVTAMLEDRSGVLWFGTDSNGDDGGVTRYDGVTFQTLYNPPHDSEYNSGHQVSSLLEDRSGNLWVGALLGGGAIRYDGTTWRRYTDGDGLPSSGSYGFSTSVNTMLQDRAGNLWFATDDAGVGRFDGSSWRAFTPDDSVVNFPAVMLEDHSGALWVGSMAGFGASRYDGTSWRTFTTADGLADDNVSSMLEDRSHHMWFAGEHGLSRYDGSNWRSFTSVDGLGGNRVSSMLEDRAGSLWFATDQGVSRFDGTTWRTFTSSDYGLPSGLAGLVEDGAGSLWGWCNDGVTRYDGTTWRTFTVADGLVGNQVNRIIVDHAGSLWFGTESGVSRFDGTSWRSFTTADGLANNSVYAIVEDRGGNIWIRHWDSHVSRIHGTTIQTFPLLCNGTPMADRAGNVWFGTNEGAVCYDGSRFLTFTTFDGLAGDAVVTMFEDRKGNVWIASYGYRGVTRYEPDRVASRTVLRTTPAALSASRDQNALFTSAFGEPGVEFSRRFDDGSWSDWSSVDHWIGNDLGDGPHTLEVRSRDRVGNLEADPVVTRFEIDATPPAPFIASPTFGQPVRGRVEIRGAAADPRFEAYTVELRPGGATSWDAPGASTIARSSTPVTSGALASWDSSTLPDGDYELRLSVTDTLGLTGTYVVAIVVDNQAPYADVTSPATVSAAGGGDIYTTHRELHLYFPPHAFDRDALVTIASAVAPDTLPGGAMRIQPAYSVEWGSAGLSRARLEFATAGRTAAAGTPAVYFSADGSSWQRLGGTVEPGDVTLAIDQPGRYALYAEGAAPEGGATLSVVSFTPRVFSPRGTYANAAVGIGFTLGRSAAVTVRVYNRAGRLMREVVAGTTLPPGANLVRWDGRDRDGGVVDDGLYVVTVEALGLTRRSPLAVVR